MRAARPQAKRHGFWRRKSCSEAIERISGPCPRCKKMAIVRRRMKLHELTTPALVAESALLQSNLRLMSEALPGSRLRPHVKAHKCTSLARLQAANGHSAFTCATISEMEGMARAGLVDDLLLANEVVDARRLGDLSKAGAQITVAVDSEATV